MPANPAGAGANGKFHRKASRLWRSQRGAVTIFALFAFLIVMITGVLVPDMGRLVMAQHQTWAAW